MLDTCLLSELTKPRPSGKVRRWVAARDEQSLFISVLTLGEVQKGVTKLPDSKKKRAIRSWFRDELLARFRKRTLAITEEVAMRWGEMQGEAEKKGHKLPVVDGLLAATALVHDLVVVTRNGDDIERSGAEVFNPWE